MIYDSVRECPVDLAIFIPSFRGGGAEKIAVLLANEVSSLGYAVDLVVAKNEGPYRDLVSSEVRILDLESERVIASLAPLIRYLRCSPPRTLLSLLNYANLVAIMAHKLSATTCRLVVSERNSPLHATQWLDRYILLPILTPLLYPFADTLICISEGIRDVLLRKLKIPPHRLVTIYNPIDLRTVRDQAESELSDPWLDDPSENILVTVGRLVPQKDHKTLLRAMAKIPNHISWKLIILGKGTLEEELRDLASKLKIEGNIKWLGFVDNPYRWVARSDLFVLSSAWEGFGNVLVEAMACGTQVISTNCPSGPSEILEDGKWGTLVEVGDHNALAEAITHQLTMPAFKDVRARSSHFNSAIVLKNYLEVLSL
jgi:glycosyltransferase involved in cell wall biosynthesis